jgi:hypothetical protein
MRKRIAREDRRSAAANRLLELDRRSLPNDHAKLGPRARRLKLECSLGYPHQEVGALRG